MKARCFIGAGWWVGESAAEAGCLGGVGGRRGQGGLGEQTSGRAAGADGGFRRAGGMEVCGQVRAGEPAGHCSGSGLGRLYNARY